MTELRYTPFQRFVPILSGLLFPAAILVIYALAASNGAGFPAPHALAVQLASYVALLAWPATLRFRTRLRYGDAGIIWRSGLGPTVRIPRSRILAWEFVRLHRSDSLWFVHYRTPLGRHRTIHIPHSLLSNYDFPTWLGSNFRDLRAIFPRRPLRFYWFTLS